MANNNENNETKIQIDSNNNNSNQNEPTNRMIQVAMSTNSQPNASVNRKNYSSWVIDPSGWLYHHWSMVVSIAFLYNFWSLSYRFAFREIDRDTMTFWFTLDYSADLIYVLDVVINFHTGYLEDGVLQRNLNKIGQHYRECTRFYLDCFCLLPLDILYLSIGLNSILRCTRLVKIYKFWSCVDRTERHTNYPNVFRTFTLVHYILVIFHWNACLFHMISKNKLIDIENLYKIDQSRCDDILCQYLHAFYWSTLSLTTIGDLPRPRTKGEFLYVIVELFFGLFVFASVLGHVANIVTNVSAARREFQAKLDAVKTFMRQRRVSEELQSKVIRWFDYLWTSQQSSDEDRSVACLPDRLKAEIAIHVHLDTLKRVDIFQNTEAGFLCELVLRLKPVLFSPGDYVCRKNEVGLEMYIVSRGVLEVVTDDQRTVVATLKAGSYFGEISVLNVGHAGNKRTASVRSVGYSDLFCLNKQDLWDVLKNHPNAEARIRARAEERLLKLDTGSGSPKKEPARDSNCMSQLHEHGATSVGRRNKQPTSMSLATSTIGASNQRRRMPSFASSMSGLKLNPQALCCSRPLSGYRHQNQCSSVTRFQHNFMPHPSRSYSLYHYGNHNNSNSNYNRNQGEQVYRRRRGPKLIDEVSCCSVESAAPSNMGPTHHSNPLDNPLVFLDQVASKLEQRCIFDSQCSSRCSSADGDDRARLIYPSDSKLRAVVQSNTEIPSSGSHFRQPSNHRRNNAKRSCFPANSGRQLSHWKNLDSMDSEFESEDADREAKRCEPSCKHQHNGYDKHGHSGRYNHAHEHSRPKLLTTNGSEDRGRKVSLNERHTRTGQRARSTGQEPCGTPKVAPVAKHSRRLVSQWTPTDDGRSVSTNWITPVVSVEESAQERRAFQGVPTLATNQLSPLTNPTQSASPSLFNYDPSSTNEQPTREAPESPPKSSHQEDSEASSSGCSHNNQPER